MKLIIDIPDETYNKMRRGETLYHADANVAIFAIETGTPLEECEDCVSRQDAIDACLNGWNKGYKEIVEEIRALPPVTSAEKQEPCEDWHDVPSDEMTLEQARQAVRDLRKMLVEYLDQEPCTDAISRQTVNVPDTNIGKMSEIPTGEEVEE